MLHSSELTPPPPTKLMNEKGGIKNTHTTFNFPACLLACYFCLFVLLKIFFLFHRDPFHAHREHVHRMMRSLSEPFGTSLMPSVTDGRNRVADPFTSSSLALRNEHRVRTLMGGGKTFFRTLKTQLVN